MFSQALTGIRLTKLLSSEKYSDMKLVCQGQEFKVHKAIVCSQSPVIAAACDGELQEAKTNIIHIEEFDAETVRCMLAFMYEGDYEVYTKQGEGGNSGTLQPPESQGNALVSMPIRPKLPFTKEIEIISLKPNTSRIHVRVNTIAEYYDIPKLRELSNLKIKKDFDTKWCPDDFSATVKQILTTGDKDMQDWAISMAAVHIEELLDHPVFRMEQVINDFGFGIIQKTALESKKALKETSEKLATAEQLCRALEAQQVYALARMTDAEARLDRILISIRDCIEKLGDTKECRNPRCDAKFTCFIAEGGNHANPTFTLRCGRCRCRHK